ncbi:MAG: DUF3185 family protein [Geminicoccaceae bacterium]|nr:MAG: DUF3185 family protein [Geminicoccaceae bacterium]
MSMSRIAGIALLAVGVVLLFFGYQASQAPVEQVAETLTGRFTESTMLYVVLGVAAVVVGGLLTLRGRG